MARVHNRKGFTLAELLIVVAIIAVLIGVSIPVFTSQLEKSREAADIANLRSTYAEIMYQALDDEKGTFSASVELTQKTPGWQTDEMSNALSMICGESNIQGSPQKDGSATVVWQAGAVKIIFGGGLPVTYSAGDYSNPVVMSEKYGQIVSFLCKNEEMPKLNSRYAYYGTGETNADKVKIITVQTGDGQTINEIKSAMTKLGYTDDEVSNVHKSLRYAYLDGDGNLIGYHGAASGGRTQLYIVGYGDNPVSADGSENAKKILAEYIQTGTISGK